MMKYADIYIGEEISKILKVNDDLCLVFTKVGKIYNLKSLLPSFESQLEDINFALSNVRKEHDCQSCFFNNYNKHTNFKGIANLDQTEKLFEMPICETNEILDDKLCFWLDRIMTHIWEVLE